MVSGQAFQFKNTDKPKSPYFFISLYAESLSRQQPCL